MMLKLKYPILLFALSIIFYSCEKEYSLEGSVLGSTAVFSFTGGSAACINPVVTGTYQAGVALGASNVVTLSVDVTTTGTYTISTATVDGFSFTGSGTFTVTGAQTISLTGSGTPISGVTGTFSFTPDPNGCSFPVTVTTSGGAGGTAVFIYGGAPGACTVATPAGTYSSGTALTSSNTVTLGVNVTTIGTWSITTPTVNGFSFTGSGSFTSATPQTVTLTATGTPVTNGVFNFTPTNNGCSFPITVNVGTAATDFIKCTIDGVARTFNDNLVGSNPDPTAFSFGGNETSAANSPSFEIDLTKPPVITTGNYNQFSITSPTTYCVGSYFDGVTITAWSIGLMGQTGSFSVNVTSYTTSRITGTFSGTIYDNDGLGSGAKTITAGQFSIPY